MPDSSTDIYDVIVVGAGAGERLTNLYIINHLIAFRFKAGLQTASHILKAKPSLRILILERSSISGGRIRDLKLIDGIEMAGVGAWKVYRESKQTLRLLQEHSIETAPWSMNVKRVEANGSTSLQARSL